ncbi:Exonuclease domain-containing protein [Sulfidibacter corallicola]|uniref:Exonuclease domain-containing protein n=1 Tax=Sulfidibacter corallicola TaxID=2818388 RepID=A0A8A4TX92_SULCO|nr:3'-5' exonuclease [Sulfidibacter corallicola]QTD53734.1 exonuclease domain-containing protein [Sulfidibacter corallicola]
MARLLDQLIIIDIEATCWQGKVPSGMVSDIIEIGVCTLDLATGERLEKESILVRPQRSTVSPFCTELTTLTQARVDGGCTFSKACTHLVETYKTKRRPWASWGDYDRRQFERQCRDTGEPYPFGTSHLNLKSLFSLLCGHRRELGMARALDHLGLTLEGTHHRGDDDAWNIGAVASHLLKRYRGLAA